MLNSQPAQFNNEFAVSQKLTTPTEESVLFPTLRKWHALIADDKLSLT